MPQKGIHNLLDIWKYVEKNTSNAELYVFGGANVWNAENKLGSNGTADKYLERIIIKKLNHLEHPENIHFMGAMGWAEIDKLISSARVGVVNPSRYMRDETFCLSAIELEAHKIPIVSRQRHDGLNSTILNGRTGFLEKEDKDMAERIITLINNPKQSIKMGENARAFSKLFIPEQEVHKWLELSFVDKSNISKKITKGKSIDAKLLRHDLFLKVIFLVESGKFLDLLLKKLKDKF